MEKLKVLLVGCGNMGYSHGKAYHNIDGYEIVGLVSRREDVKRRGEVAKELAISFESEFDDYYSALSVAKPDVVSINTYPDSHAEYVLAALDAGCHVFVEKPLATSVADCEKIRAKALKFGLKVVVGYILRHHPVWERFVSEIRNLGKPLVMRISLNQQSHGQSWEVHKLLMKSVSPIVDCGVHYVDMMCLMTQAKPIKVQAIGARLSEDVKMDMYNYGQLQVTFEDGSVGWFESGFGPMISQQAFFVRDVFGPNGSVSFVDKTDSDNTVMGSVVSNECLLLHHAATDKDGSFSRPDEVISLDEASDFDTLCRREQEFLLRAIREDIDLSKHLEDAVNSLKIVLAADESFRTDSPVKFDYHLAEK